MGFQEDDHRNKVSLCQGYILSIRLATTVDVGFDHLAELVFVRFLPSEVTLFPSFYTMHFGKKSLCAALT